MFLLDMFEVLEVIILIQIIVQHRHDMRDLRRFEEIRLLIQRVKTTDISTRTGRARDGQSQGRERDEQTLLRGVQVACTRHEIEPAHG